MSEQKLLTKVAHKIWFLDKWLIYHDMMNVREIIFTEEFMYKFNKYRIHQLDLDVYWKWDNSRMWEILNNLDYPAKYLY